MCQSYGPHQIAGATLISLPAAGAGGVDFFAAPPNREKRPRIELTVPSGKAGEVQPAKAPRVSPKSVGVMDIGQGNCNLVFAEAEPILYYDTGFPTWFYKATAPPTVWANAAGPAVGPIAQNQQNNLEVVLSHWDWDHYRLAQLWPALKQLQWTVPRQARGPTAINFFNSLPNKVEYGGELPAPPVAPRGNYSLYTCEPVAGAPAATIMNNTGLAIHFQAALPSGGQAENPVLLTGDANIDSLRAAPPPIAGLLAVHHGSRANGAPDNLVPPPVLAPGRIAYSYGVRPNGHHAHGFPAAEAVAKYTAAGWGAAAAQRTSTAEGPEINNNGMANRGNIRVGDQTPILWPGTSAFEHFPNQLV